MGLTVGHVEAVRKGARVSRGLSTRNQHPRFVLLSLSLSLSLYPYFDPSFYPFVTPRLTLLSDWESVDIHNKAFRRRQRDQKYRFPFLLFSFLFFETLSYQRHFPIRLQFRFNMHEYYRISLI